MSSASAAIPERFKWAARLVNPQAQQHIIEIGCGTGLLASLLAKDLVTGSCTCIDRSAPMISKAEKNNRELINKKKLIVLQASFPCCDDLQAGYYDLVVAFNVNVFLRSADNELQAIRDLLSEKGKLFIFYQAPYEINKSAATPIIANLEKNGFTISQVLLKKLDPVSAIAVEAFMAHDR